MPSHPWWLFLWMDELLKYHSTWCLSMTQCPQISAADLGPPSIRDFLAFIPLPNIVSYSVLCEHGFSIHRSWKSKNWCWHVDYQAAGSNRQKQQDLFCLLRNRCSVLFSCTPLFFPQDTAFDAAHTTTVYIICLFFSTRKSFCWRGSVWDGHLNEKASSLRLSSASAQPPDGLFLCSATVRKRATSS